MSRLTGDQECVAPGVCVSAVPVAAPSATAKIITVGPAAKIGGISAVLTGG
jgi:hypothetical protein